MSDDEITFTVSGTSFTVPVTSVTTSSSSWTQTSASGLSGAATTYTFPSSTTIYSNAGNINIPKIPCAHITAEETAEYIDGTVYANCALCNERIQIARIPGGLALIAAKSLVTALTLGVEDDSLKLLNELSDQLEANRQALEEFEGLIGIARQMVKESCE